MNTGLQDAINLGWKLGLVCRGKARSELLDTYEVERLPVIEKILSGTDAATRAVTIRKAVGQHVFNALARLLLGFEPVRDYLTRSISEMEINYRGAGMRQLVLCRARRPPWRAAPGRPCTARSAPAKRFLKAGKCGCTT